MITDFKLIQEDALSDVGTIVVIRVMLVTFDNFENRTENAIRRQLLTAFVDDNKWTAWDKANKFIHSLEPSKTRREYDGNIYPYIEFRRCHAK